MFQSFTVKNYRCFTDLTIEPCARINLIAGKNNVGKTALLEALAIHYHAEPAVTFEVDFLRGFQPHKNDPKQPKFS